MNITAEEIEGVWAAFIHRVVAIRMAGGISSKSVLEGESIPDGWVLDMATEYYIPPNLLLEPIGWQNHSKLS